MICKHFELERIRENIQRILRAKKEVFTIFIAAQLQAVSFGCRTMQVQAMRIQQDRVRAVSLSLKTSDCLPLKQDTIH